MKKLLYDFFPLLLFFVTFKAYGIFIATGIAIIASLIQIGVFWLQNRRFEKMHLISAGLLVVFGGLTIALQDRAFVMWKPTILYWLFAAGLLISLLLSKGSAFQGLLSLTNNQIDIPTRIFKRADLMLAVFFVLLGIINLWYAYEYFNAESALRLAHPGITEAQITELVCDTGFPANAIQHCQSASEAEKSWVNFKVFGSLILTFVFMFGISLYLSRYMPEQLEKE